MRSSYDTMGSMDFAQIQLFRDIVQSRSISRGAAMNGVTQSAASQALQELERQLGARLLDRSHRPLEVLPAGRLFYDFAREVLRRQQEFGVLLEEMKGTGGGTVRVAAIYSVGLTEMAKLEKEFYRRLPSAQLEVNYLRPEKVYEAVAEERADIGLISYPEPTREITVLPWREETMVLACSPRAGWRASSSSASTTICRSAATCSGFCASTVCGCILPAVSTIFRA